METKDTPKNPEAAAAATDKPKAKRERRPRKNKQEDGAERPQTAKEPQYRKKGEGKADEEKTTEGAAETKPKK